MAYIYFIQESLNGSIKIGLSFNIQKRLFQLQRGLPQELKVIGCLEGDHADEKMLHEKFNNLWIRGEWYKPEKELLQFIEDNAKISQEAQKAIEKWMQNKDECRELIEKADSAKLIEGNKLLTIEETAKLLGVSSQTLRNWEKAGKITPTKTEGGHRRYSEQNITELRKQMMMGAETLVRFSPEKLKQWLYPILDQFDPNEKLDISFRHDVLMNKIRLTISSQDGLTSITKSFDLED